MCLLFLKPLFGEGKRVVWSGLLFALATALLRVPWGSSMSASQLLSNMVSFMLIAGVRRAISGRSGETLGKVECVLVFGGRCRFHQPVLSQRQTAPVHHLRNLGGAPPMGRILRSALRRAYIICLNFIFLTCNAFAVVACAG